MENLEEIAKKPKIRMFDVLLGTIPITGLTALGIGMAVYGTIKKESAAVGLGAIMTAMGTGFLGYYIYSVNKLINEHYNNNEKLINKP